jgi:hypothetical protein
MVRGVALRIERNHGSTWASTEQPRIRSIAIEPR